MLWLALGHVRQHRVGGVAQERDPPARPRFERRPVEERPLEDLLGTGNHRAHLGMPIREES
jgi:hypothetical protein